MLQDNQPVLDLVLLVSLSQNSPDYPDGSTDSFSCGVRSVRSEELFFFFYLQLKLLFVL